MSYTTGYAHGKIILMGEHSVVYNQPAIALPLNNIQVKASIKKSHKLEIDCAFYRGLVSEMPELFKSLQNLILNILNYLNRENEKFNLKLTSEIPIERGMGSSAAVAVATTRAIFSYFNETISKDKLLYFVNISETIAHGKPSGIDALITSSNQPYYFIKSKETTEIPLCLDANLIVADTGITGQTKLAVNIVKEKVQKIPSTQGIINSLGELTTKAKHAMTINDPYSLGRYMSESHSYLNKLGISNEQLNNLVNTALQNNALGAKLTGGGLGGCMIALVNSENSKLIQEKLLAAGAKQVWEIPLKGNHYDENHSKSTY